ncbi:MAG: hypothetical protein HC894_01565 [Microcoleus sp. SM1_3_4]|nr:hypothetical protein [Microcoleus sp. SM1_3_4]
MPEANQQFELRLANQLLDKTTQHAGKNKLNLFGRVKGDENGQQSPSIALTLTLTSNLPSIARTSIENQKSLQKTGKIRNEQFASERYASSSSDRSCCDMEQFAVESSAAMRRDRHLALHTLG